MQGLAYCVSIRTCVSWRFCRPICIAVVVFASCLSGGQAIAADGVLWDDRPAEKWDNAYPVGNGRLGAMPMGQFPREMILVNEETIWARSPDDAFEMPNDSVKHLEAVRKLEASGDYRGADRYFERHLQNGREPDGYQLLGWLRLEYQDAAPLQQLHRELELKSGIAKNVYTLEDGTHITQKVFASGPDDVIAVLISADRNISVDVSIDGGLIDDGDLVKNGAGTGASATRFVGRVRAFPSDQVEATSDRLQIKNSKEIAIYLSAATNFDRGIAGRCDPMIGKPKPFRILTISMASRQKMWNRRPSETICSISTASTLILVAPLMTSWLCRHVYA